MALHDVGSRELGEGFEDAKALSFFDKWNTRWDDSYRIVSIY
jgi:hypothetical protein